MKQILLSLLLLCSLGISAQDVVVTRQKKQQTTTNNNHKQNQLTIKPTGTSVRGIEAVSYVNMMKLVKMSSMSRVEQTLQEWGFSLIKRENDGDIKYSYWSYGAAKYDNYGNHSITTEHSVLVNIGSVNGAVNISFYFKSSSLFNQLKNQVKSNGWKIYYSDSKTNVYTRTGKESWNNSTGKPDDINLVEQNGYYEFSHYEWYGG